METTTGGAPGLLLISFCWILQFMHHFDKANITFVLGTISAILAIVYYVLQIRKINKK